MSYSCDIRFRQGLDILEDFLNALGLGGCYHGALTCWVRVLRSLLWKVPCTRLSQSDSNVLSEAVTLHTPDMRLTDLDLAWCPQSMLEGKLGVVEHRLGVLWQIHRSTAVSDITSAIPKWLSRVP